MHPLLRTLLATGILLTAALTILPQPAQAANGDWHNEVVTSTTAPVVSMKGASNGEKIGLGYKYYTASNPGNGLIGFSVRSTAGIWTQKSADITGAGTLDYHLENVRAGTASMTTWYILTEHSSTTLAQIWKSTDDGATWTLMKTMGTATGSDDGEQMDFEVLSNGAGGDFIRAIDGGGNYKESSDSGSTWSSDVFLMDNSGSGIAATNTITSGGPVAMLYPEVVFARTAATFGSPSAVQAIYDVVGGGGAWTVAYGAANPCPAGYADLASTPCPIKDGLAGSLNGRVAGAYAVRIWSRGGLLESLESARSGPVNPVFPTNPQVTPEVIATLSGSGSGHCSAGFVHANQFSSHAPLAVNSAGLAMTAYTCASGSPTGFTVMLRDYANNVGWSQSYNQATTSRANDVLFTPSRAYAFYTNSSLASRTELVWSSAPTAVNPTANASATVTGLVGFDVDPTGGTAIARYASGATVGVFSAQTLGSAVQTVATGCNRDSGVTAFTLNVAYVSCDPSTHNADYLRIRTNQLNHITSVPLSQCDADHPIHTGEDDYTLNADPEAFANEVRTFQLLSIDFTQAQGSSTNGFAGTGVGVIKYCRLQAAFGTSFETGKIGVLTADAAKCFADDCHANIDGARRIASAWSQYDPSGNPISHMCAVLPITIPGQSSQAAVMAADDSGTTKIYSWNRDTFTPQVALAESASGPFAQGRGIGCGKGDRILVETATQLAAFNVTSQTQAWAPKTLPSVPPQRGVAMSYDGKWGAFVNGTTVQLVNMTSGATPSCGAIPLTAGTFKELRLTEKAQDLFIATSTTIERWDVHVCTTLTPQGQGSFDDACGPTSPTACPGAGGPGSGSSLTNSLTGNCGLIKVCDPNVIPAAFNGFLGILLVIAIAGGLFFLSGSIAFAGLGAGVGYLLGIFFGVLPLWPILVLVVGALAFIFLKAKGGG